MAKPLDLSDFRIAPDADGIYHLSIVIQTDKALPGNLLVRPVTDLEQVKQAFTDYLCVHTGDYSRHVHPYYNADVMALVGSAEALCELTVVSMDQFARLGVLVGVNDASPPDMLH